MHSSASICDLSQLGEFRAKFPKSLIPQLLRMAKNNLNVYATIMTALTFLVQDGALALQS